MGFCENSKWVCLVLGIFVLIELETHYCVAIDRSSFPPAFQFGFSTSAYQVEGGAHDDGRGLSIWDTFCSIPGKIVGGANGDVAADAYHRYKEDVQILKNLGTDVYRFSISWPRVFPGGSTRHGEVNRKGVQYYNNLINELIENGIEPMLTIFHWDVPQVLEDEYGGFRSKRILDDYSEFAEFCFKEFGDRVKKWITINEPSIFATHGYGNGINAPGRCSAEAGNCPEGDSSREPYIVAHNLLLAHMHAVKIYRTKYEGKQKGIIGISVHSDWYMPYSSSKLDVDATQRVMDNTLGLYLDPIMFGDYPSSVKRLVGDRLPVFTKQESVDIKGSFDFIGMNHYVTLYVMDLSNAPPQTDEPAPDNPVVQDAFAYTTILEASGLNTCQHGTCGVNAPHTYLKHLDITRVSTVHVVWCERTTYSYLKHVDLTRVSTVHVVWCERTTYSYMRDLEGLKKGYFGEKNYLSLWTNQIWVRPFGPMNSIFCPFGQITHKKYMNTSFCPTAGAKDGVEIGPSEGGVTYWRSYPQGIKLLLDYVKTKYRNPPVYITEIGYVTLDEGQPIENILNDTDRIEFIEDSLTYTLQAMRDGADIRGLMLWSYIDNFEWDSGYPFRLGLYYVNYTNNNMQRIPKASGIWFRNTMNPKWRMKPRQFGRLPYLISKSSS